jgi:hypothetical protein
MRSKAFQFVMLSIVSLVGGCHNNANDRVAVGGQVLIDGKPLTNGTIRFVPESGRPVSSAILADGSFRLASESVNQLSAVGVPLGKYRIQVSASNVVDDSTIRWNAPARYADFRTSGLDVTIQKPTDDLVIELTWDDTARPPENDRPSGADDSSKTDDTNSSPSGGDAPSSDKSEGGNAI